MTSEAGALLLGATDRAIGLVHRSAGCFSDGRVADRVVHDVATLVGQRVFRIALGYEDLADRDELRRDPVLGAVLGRLEARRRDCAPLAGKSTLNRLEHAPEETHRYRRIGHDADATEEVERIVGQIRARWSAVEIVLRADSGFAREPLMAWCEDNGVDYVFGLARKPRLVAHLQPALDRAGARSRESGRPARLFTEFRYRT